MVPQQWDTSPGLAAGALPRQGQAQHWHRWHPGLILEAAGTRLQQGCWDARNLSLLFHLLQKGGMARQNQERASQKAK